MSFTEGTTRNEYARIYDRLRKRSLRSERAINTIIDEWAAQVKPFGEDLEAWSAMTTLADTLEIRQYGTTVPTAHEAYVRGVRDALAAVEAL